MRNGKRVLPRRKQGVMRRPQKKRMLDAAWQPSPLWPLPLWRGDVHPVVGFRRTLSTSARGSRWKRERHADQAPRHDSRQRSMAKTIRWAALPPFLDSKRYAQTTPIRFLLWCFRLTAARKAMMHLEEEVPW